METIDPEKIRQFLIEMTSAFGQEFITIGGWAIHAYGAHGKSLDGDAMVSYQVEGVLRDSYRVEKNPRMAKSQFICEAGCDIDLYVEHQHRLPISFEEIQAHCQMHAGLQVPCPEHLLVLKVVALKARAHSAKGAKDQEDVLNLLALAPITKPKVLETHLGLEPELRRMIEDILAAPETAQRICGGNAAKAKTLRSKAKKNWEMAFPKKIREDLPSPSRD